MTGLVKYIIDVIANIITIKQVLEKTKNTLKFLSHLNVLDLRSELDFGIRPGLAS